MDDFDYLAILATLRELPFSVGKGTLVEILSGAVTKKMISNTTYMDLQGYGSLQDESPARIEQWIDRLQTNGFLTLAHPPGKPHMRVVEITSKGVKELKNPTLDTAGYTSNFGEDHLDPESAVLIEQFNFFLSQYTLEQQHAIVSPAKKILCVAGAGTGKTTVLTKRIEFLVRFRGVDPKEILAITFTRKARAEMQHRLAGIPVEVSTFNGFCERLLRAHNKARPIVNYGQKIRLFHEVLAAEQIDMHGLVLDYFSDTQRKGSTKDELERRLIGDVYSLVDHFANEDEPIPSRGRSALASTLLAIARRLQKELASRGYGDYSGQLRDVLSGLRNTTLVVPQYRYILVDEYQDINIAQAKLIDLLNPECLFVVGDPRQSIFGWRGSQLKFITDFQADKTIQLRTNFRSRPKIVAVMNRLITHMGLPDLEAANTDGGVVQALKYTSEDDELRAVATLVEHAMHKDIFVLARTNRQLLDLSAILAARKVAFSIKHEDEEAVPDGVVLATAHAIKGLEARTVIVLGATSRYFPCKVSDHPVVDLLKDSTLDREEEEKRLLYVAVSRAKEQLILTYTGTPTYFLDGVVESAQKKLVPKLSVRR